MGEVRLGLVGVGPWAERYVAAAKSLAHPKARVVAYARQRSADVSWLPDAERADGMTFIERGLVDAVIVACGPAAAGRYVELALKTGMPALVEKPVTTEPGEANKLLRFATKEPGASVSVGYVHLYAPAYLMLRTLLAEHCTSKADQIRCIELEGAGLGPFRSYSSLWDYGPHDASMLFDLLDAVGQRSHSLEISRVEHFKGASALRGERWAFDVNVGPTLARISVSNVSAEKVRRLVVDTWHGHRYVYDDRKPHLEKLTVDGAVVRVNDRGALTVMLERFVGRVADRSTRKHLHDLELTVRVTDLLKTVEKLGSETVA